MAVQADEPRAIYAADPRQSRGRVHAEPAAHDRNVFRRDCDRIIHTAAFRRLEHKTQVFVPHEGDHYRTRLTHTLEVTQIARSLARSLGLDEDLTEALALAHDLGHPPFGHAGETALDACLHAHGGFDHNVQTLRLVTSLDRRYAAFDGLNLTWETLDGLIKHNGPLLGRDGAPLARYAQAGAPVAIVRLARLLDIDLAAQTSAEGQAAAIADDIAYDAHDIDDGLRAGLFGLDDVRAIAPLDEGLSEIEKLYPGLAETRAIHELRRRLIARMMADVVAESGRRLAALSPRSADDVRSADGAVVGFSAAMAESDRAIKAFLFPRMYRYPRVTRIGEDAKRVVADLYGHFTADLGALPAPWREGLGGADAGATARRVGDFIAGMTDRFALAEHAKYFDTTPDLR